MIFYTNDLFTWFKESYIWSSFDAFATILSVMVVFPLAVQYFELKNWMRKNIFLRSKKYIVVDGFGSKSRIYIDSELKDKTENIFVITQSSDEYIREYTKKGVAIIKGDIKDRSLLKKLHLEDAKHLTLLDRSDIENLEILSIVTQEYPNLPIYSHIEDRSVRAFHKEHGLLQSNSLKIFSYAEEASRELFEKFDIDGEESTIIESDKAFNIAIVGASRVAYEVIRQACIMGQLPHENRLTIYCIDRNPDAFRSAVLLCYPNISDVPNVTIEYLSLDIDTIEFYKDAVWKKYFTNIILSFSDEQKNLDVASNLANITYLEEIADSMLRTKIILAMPYASTLCRVIQQSSESFGNFQTFANLHNIATKEYIINAQRDMRAIRTNRVYSSKNPLHAKPWDRLSYFEKESNRASADHIKIKQKYLTLDSSPEAKERLATCEHNRWSAFHFLNGYSLGEKNHAKKKHNSLIPYDNLSFQYKEYDREMVNSIDEIIMYKIEDRRC